MSPITTEAIVAYGPHDLRRETLTHLREILDDELLVDMVASGVCHTDLADFGVYSRVVGHEGAGYVRATGKNVKAAQPGDPVLLSFDSCGSCHYCNTHHPAYCTTSQRRTIFANDPIYSTAEGNPIGGRFFGQSSFMRTAIAAEGSVVNVKHLLAEGEQGREELKMLAPLGCGLMTGSGTIATVAQAGEADSIVILGVGGVGLAGIITAKILNCRRIVAVDIHESRLQLATELGATHTVNSSTCIPLGQTSLVHVIRAITDGLGATVTMDTTGIIPLIAQAIDFTRPRGKIIQVGSAGMAAKLEIPVQAFMGSGRQYMGAIQGDSVPSDWIPKLIKWWREGKFPFDRLVRFYKAEDFENAVKDMHEGRTIKPVLLW